MKTKFQITFDVEVEHPDSLSSSYVLCEVCGNMDWNLSYCEELPEGKVAIVKTEINSCTDSDGCKESFV